MTESSDLEDGDFWQVTVAQIMQLKKNYMDYEGIDYERCQFLNFY